MAEGFEDRCRCPPETWPEGERRDECLPFEYARADRAPQMELPGLERVRRPEMTMSMRRMLDVRYRHRKVARRLAREAGRQNGLYWMRENTAYSER